MIVKRRRWSARWSVRYLARRKVGKKINIVQAYAAYPLSLAGCSLLKKVSIIADGIAVVARQMPFHQGAGERWATVSRHRSGLIF